MRRFMLIVMLSATSLHAEEPMTNGEVVKLVKAGLSAETILAKISSSQTKFDTSTDALVALASEGVPDEVIRAMVKAGTPRPAPAPPVQPATSGARRYDVAIHRSNGGKCDGELKMDKAGVKATRCRDLDFTLDWKDVKSVCYEYGFRGVMEFRTSNATHRISTSTPAEAKRIVDTIRNVSPSVSRLEGCRGK